ncbi:MAG TPA: glycosyltransferase [Candidatus Omnitrophota bacterium]|nr:glycosyltransferase [Candidatus Omnitrophota bacterium]
MSNHPRVLLMHITRTSGHHRATVAIENALRIIRPDVETMNINGFAYVYPVLEKIANAIYMNIIKRRPKIWEYLYDNPRVIKKTGTIKKILNNSRHARLAKLFKKFNPEVVICSQAFPCGMVGDFKKRYKYPVKLIGVLTDFAPHHYWVHGEVDYYIVPTQEAAYRLVQEGISKERIKVYGIPADPKFASSADKARVAGSLGLDLDTPVILVMGGGHGLGPIKTIVKALAQLKNPFQLIILTGINKKTLKIIKMIKFPHGQKVMPLSYVDNVHELMEIASFVITKPGGMTTAECLVKGLPMVIVNPIPGQEARNTELLLKKGVAVQVNDLAAIGDSVRRLLESPERLHDMRQSAKAHGKPNAAIDIAKLALES